MFVDCLLLNISSFAGEKAPPDAQLSWRCWRDWTFVIDGGSLNMNMTVDNNRRIVVIRTGLVVPAVGVAPPGLAARTRDGALHRCCCAETYTFHTCISPERVNAYATASDAAAFIGAVGRYRFQP